MRSALPVIAIANMLAADAKWCPAHHPSRAGRSSKVRKPNTTKALETKDEARQRKKAERKRRKAGRR